METRSLDDLIEVLRHSRNTRQRGCSLLIGAGCSVTAGIRSAAGFVELIRERFKEAYNRAATKMRPDQPGYPQCMAELSRGQQRDLINEQVSNARINWAHISIAQLIRNGYIDRVLTTNFDPLALRACAMLGEFPAVYDFAISQLFRPGELPERAIFHLHGQSTGFVLMNTEAEVQAQSERLGSLFLDAGRARPWIVVGYSGDNDPVFDHLAATERFDYFLFWVGFKDEEPKKHVREKLLQPVLRAEVMWIGLLGLRLDRSGVQGRDLGAQRFQVAESFKELRETRPERHIALASRGLALACEFDGSRPAVSSFSQQRKPLIAKLFGQ
jgi:hypothetical protein